MINDLDETLKQLLIQKAQLDPAEVDISFDTPTRDWSTPVTRPTINLYLFDIRENRTLRELDWDDEPSGYGQVRRLGMPVIYRDPEGREYTMRALRPGWDALPVRLGGVVHDKKGQPIGGAAVRLIGTQADGRPVQVGPTLHTDAAGRYVLPNVPPG